MSNKNLQAALRYATYGWAVFPLRPGQKTPASLHGFHDATTDTGQITRWWTEMPDAGVGIATGTPSGLIVLDVDPRNNGHHSLAAIRAQYDDWQPTAESVTGGGGRHYFFKHPGGVLLPSAKPWPGIDIKAEGGYVVACPSIHPSGLMYRWAPNADPDNLACQPAPDWLVTLLRERRSKLIQDVEQPEDKNTFKLGNRNAALTSLAGTMQRRGMSYDAILAALLAENTNKCKPPLPEGEIAQIVTSVSRYAPDANSTPQNPTTTVALGSPLMDVSGALDEDPPEVMWLLDGWLAKGDCALMAGDPGAGKSWLGLDIGIAGASGIPIWDHFAHETFRVLIVDEENPPDEVRRRLHAIALARGVKSKHLDGRLMLTEPRHGFGFKDALAKDGLKRRIQDFAPDLIIFDSITAVSTILDEGQAPQIRRFFHDELNPLQTICGSTILCIHHTNKSVYHKDRDLHKGGLIRGSIDYVAAADAVWLLDSQEKQGTITLTNVKPRRTSQPEALQIKIMDTASGGVYPVVVNDVINPSTSPHTAWDFIALCLTSKDWVKGPTLYEQVFTVSNGKISRGSYDIAIMRLVQAGKVEKQTLDPTNRFSAKLYRLI